MPHANDNCAERIISVRQHHNEFSYDQINLPTLYFHF